MGHTDPGVIVGTFRMQMKLAREVIDQYRAKSAPDSDARVEFAMLSLSFDYEIT